MEPAPMDDNVVQLRTDTVVADELRNELIAPLAEVCRTMTKAQRAGLQLMINIPMDQFGRFVAQITVTKPL